MQEQRTHRAKKNVIFTLLNQLVATLCGIMIPRIMIGTFGSAAYGASTSIAQFLSYISLFEGGIGGVARGELYRPLAQQNDLQISKVYHAIKRFFSKLGIVFVVYTLFLAVFYYDLAKVSIFDRKYTFFLVLAIGLSTFGNYMGGIANLTLMNADQKQYLSNIIIMCTNILNTVCILILVNLGSDILVVKLVSSMVFILRPLAYSGYVKRNYTLPKVDCDSSTLKQKWTGIGQHIAYFLHTNTDVVLLTLLSDLNTVAVYSVYLMVAKSIWNISSSFSGGMEAAFGELIAKKEQKLLETSFQAYKVLLTIVSLTLFGTAIILIVPFIRLYTAGITDADYVQPVFGLILLMAEAINCLVLPCTSMPVSGNHLKQTRWGSYMEALINIVVSLILIPWNPLLGVATGTLLATFFKAIYFIHYTAKNFLYCSFRNLLTRFCSYAMVLLVSGLAGMALFWNKTVNNYFVWALWGVCIVVIMFATSLILCRIQYPAELKYLMSQYRGKIRKIFGKSR